MSWGPLSWRINFCTACKGILGNKFEKVFFAILLQLKSLESRQNTVIRVLQIEIITILSTDEF